MGVEIEGTQITHGDLRIPRATYMRLQTELGGAPICTFSRPADSFPVDEHGLLTIKEIVWEEGENEADLVRWLQNTTGEAELEIEWEYGEKVLLLIRDGQVTLKTVNCPPDSPFSEAGIITMLTGLGVRTTPT